MRASEFINEGFSDKLPGMGMAKGLRRGLSGLATGAANLGKGIMTKASDSDGDWLKGQLHRFGGGMFGQQGNMAATKINFIKNFVQEYNQITKSARASGLEIPSMEEYVSDYIDQAGWRVNPTQVNQIVSSSGNNIQAIANGVYAIGMMNRSRRAARPNQQGQVGQPTNQGSGGDSDDGQTTPQGQKVVNDIGDLENPRDLSVAAKAAMNHLNDINKPAYAELRKEVQTGVNI